MTTSMANPAPKLVSMHALGVRRICVLSLVRMVVRRSGGGIYIRMLRFHHQSPVGKQFVGNLPGELFSHD